MKPEPAPLPAIAPPALPPLSPGARFRAWMNMLWLDHSFFRFFYNLRLLVAPGLYRSSHPMPYQLRAAARAGVKSVLNLRGVETHVGSNVLEWDACREAGLHIVHFPMPSRDPPEPGQVLGLVRLFETLPKPILVHCKSGADRAGLASTVYRLTQVGEPLEAAIRELAFWRHGHVRQAKTGVLDHFFEVYREHRDRHGTAFLDWVRKDYDRQAVKDSFHSQWWANQLVDFVLRRE